MKKIIYIKKFPKNIDKILSQNEGNPARSRKKNFAFELFFQIVPSAFIMCGIVLIGMVIYPVFIYQFQFIPKTLRREMLKPIKIFQNYEIRASNQDDLNKQSAAIAISKVDTTNPKTWFPKAKFKAIKPSKINNYTISIAKLEIQNANVEVGDKDFQRSDLKKSLIHFPGSALPGDLGNPVIFGHSSLPLFYNPKMYETIFSELPALTKGDEIVARVDGIEYVYVVYNFFTVDPDAIDVLEQKYDKYDMTLITCVPPGTIWKRLIVKARLKEN